MTAARNFGFVFRSRTPESITVVEAGQKVVYELLAVLDFNNVRKRMSVIGERWRHSVCFLRCSADCGSKLAVMLLKSFSDR